MFFVNDDESEVGGLDVSVEECVRSDEDVYGALGESFECGLLFIWRLESGQAGDVDAQGSQSLTESLPVLECQEGCGCEDQGLVAACECAHGGVQHDFGFAIAGIAGEESVHRVGLLQVVEDLANDFFLGACWGVRCEFLEGFDPVRVNGLDVSAYGFASCMSL